MASIKDVAQLAKVSTATVSRVLANKPHVRPALRQRVLDAVDALGYRPNLVARSLRAQKSNFIGLIVADIRNPFFSDISRSVEYTAYSDQFNIFLCNSDENPDKEQVYINLMRDENVAGLIVAPTYSSAKNFHLNRFGFPVVVIDRSVRIDEKSCYDVILIDNVDAAYRLTTHLIENGRRNIAGIFGAKSFTGEKRRKGFERALRDAGLPVKPENMLLVAPRRGEGSKAANHLLNLPDRPDAIFTTNSLLTAGAFQSILDSELSVPDDIAIVGFDEAPWSNLVRPSITVIAQPTVEIGRMATNMLLERIKNPDTPAREVILKGKLLIRESSKP
jgi:LacI family fructose operon transcriptional repressor